MCVHAVSRRSKRLAYPPLHADSVSYASVLPRRLRWRTLITSDRLLIGIQAGPSSRYSPPEVPKVAIAAVVLAFWGVAKLLSTGLHA